MIVVTTNDLAGYRIVRQVGMVRGISVRSRNAISNIGGAIQIFFGGSITIYQALAERARQESYDLMVAEAERLGANAILAMRYDANEIVAAVTEMVAYGTAVVVEPIGPQ